ncbi:MAG: hypothetical protein HUJ25_05600 [Crocinitomicaceae bacterium]|nr:hypothetical protein [Crocinitomicaceae bacterium]
MKKSVLFLSCAFILFSQVSCDKFDEGGAKKKAEQNLTNVWEIDAYFLDGVNQTSDLLISNFNETFADNGTYARFYTNNSSEEVSETGSWSFSEDKSTVNFSGAGAYDLTTESSGVATSSYTIIRLTKKELWYSFDSNGKTHHFRMVAQQ